MNKLKIKIQKCISFIFIDKKIRLSQFETITDLNQSQAIYSSLSFQFLIMLTAASLISSLGLLSDSGVIIVGAMLIAPLMKPIMALSYGISIGDSSLKLRSCITLAIGIILTVFISYLSELILQLNSITEQMESRIKPNLFDLGVAISAGIAAAMAMTRRSVADSLPGVAIAVAIVPPLCVAGISLSMGKLSAFYGALLLFAINLFAIVISAICVFLLSGYGSIKNAFVFIVALTVLLVTTAFPLKESLVVIDDTDRVQSILENWLYENYPENVSIHPADLNSIRIVDLPDHIFVFIELKSPENGLSDQQITFLHDKFEVEFSKPVNLKIQLLLTQKLKKYNYTNNLKKNLVYDKDLLIPRK
jgi:uncharacterized hydrophobic protein (TIGR00271 family)